MDDCEVHWGLSVAGVKIERRQRSDSGMVLAWVSADGLKGRVVLRVERGIQ